MIKSLPFNLKHSQRLALWVSLQYKGLTRAILRFKVHLKLIDIHQEDERLLREAVDDGDFSMVQFLIDQGADLHARKDYALRFSSEQGHLPMVRYLIERGALIQADDGYALSIASRLGHLEIARLLLEQGALVHANHEYALFSSAKRGNLPMMKLLLEYQANHNYNHGLLVIQCVEAQQFSAAELLIQCGISIEELLLHHTIHNTETLHWLKGQEAQQEAAQLREEFLEPPTSSNTRKRQRL